MTPNEWRDARLAEARRIVTSPALCRAHPGLRALAWCALKKAQGTPILQVPPARRPQPRLSLVTGATDAL